MSNKLTREEALNFRDAIRKRFGYKAVAEQVTNDITGQWYNRISIYLPNGSLVCLSSKNDADYFIYEQESKHQTKINLEAKLKERGERKARLKAEGKYRFYHAFLDLFR